MNSKGRALIEVLFIMAALQGAKFLIEYLVTPFFPETLFADKMITMCVMLLLTGIVILYANLRKTKLSLLPKRFSKRYIISTIIVSALFIATPSNYIEGFPAIMVLIYGSIVTPIYEELLFRGFIWNRLEPAFKGKYTPYILTSVLFGLWHIGYMLPQLTQGNRFAVISKVAVGLIYGFILGFVRNKTKNCYSTILLHGLMNLFAF